MQNLSEEKSRHTPGPWSACFEHRSHICVMLGDAKHSYVHFRNWNGVEGWQYTRFSCGNRRTRKLRSSAVEAMLAAPGLSTASRQAAAEAVRAAIAKAEGV